MIEAAVEVATDVGTLWAPATCRFVTPALEQTGTWEREDGAALARALEPGMTVVDVGAHVGYFALLAARLVGPSGRVIALEPAPENFRLLEANVARSGLVNIETVNAAAWRRGGEVELALCAANSGDHRVGLANADRPRITVRAVALDELIGPDTHVDFVLLDTQGSEAAVVEGMHACIERCRPLLQVEFWPAGIRDLGGDPGGVLATYRELGYDIGVLGDASARDPVAAAEANTGGFVTLLLTPHGSRDRRTATATLSVCIPTHDGRRDALGYALDSVLAQRTGDRVEVVVSDNASRDGTRGLVERLPVVYRRNDSDVGAAANVMRAVEAASGDYVWLLGSDDRLEPGALTRALELLDTHPGASGMTVGKRNFDAGLQLELPDETEQEMPAHLRVYSDAETVFAECGLAHGTMSTQLCHRLAWLDAAAREDPLPRTRFAPHLLVIARMVLANPRWIWCPDRLVAQRFDPASPAQYGYRPYAYLAAILADVEPLWAHVFGRRSRTYAALLDGWCEFVLTPRRIADHKLQPAHGLPDDARMLVGFARHAWRSPYFRRHSLPALLMPHRLAKSR